jgi:hypothetical protein
MPLYSSKGFKKRITRNNKKLPTIAENSLPTSMIARQNPYLPRKILFTCKEKSPRR